LPQCHVTDSVMVSSYGPHFGEESPLVGLHGSGTVFFTYCNLQCVFCQNYTISQEGNGDRIDADTLARMMLSLQKRGCHNINLVSPTHVVPYILEALEIAAKAGLHLPLVYNTGGYDSIETLELLDGIIDIYMPDMKYSIARIAEELSGIKDYPNINKAAVREMYRQVGDLQINDNGIAERGLLVRHLVLPDGLSGTAEILDFLVDKISRNTYVNIMSQYRPAYQAFTIPSLSRALTGKEYNEAVHLARKKGLNRLGKYY